MASTSFALDRSGPQLSNSGDVQLLVPANDVAEPELSIVIPALNEQVTIGQFVDWCQQGLGSAGVCGEVLIIDSSTDSTPQIALLKGARVLKVPKRGLGRAYIDAIPFIRGRYVLMGDADCTYDFRELGSFIENFVPATSMSWAPDFAATSNQVPCRLCTSIWVLRSPPGF